MYIPSQEMRGTTDQPTILLRVLDPRAAGAATCAHHLLRLKEGTPSRFTAMYLSLGARHRLHAMQTNRTGIHTHTRTASQRHPHAFFLLLPFIPLDPVTLTGAAWPLSLTWLKSFVFDGNSAWQTAHLKPKAVELFALVSFCAAFLARFCFAFPTLGTEGVSLSDAPMISLMVVACSPLARTSASGSTRRISTSDRGA